MRRASYALRVLTASSFAAIALVLAGPGSATPADCAPRVPYPLGPREPHPAVVRVHVERDEFSLAVYALAATAGLVFFASFSLCSRPGPPIR